MVWHSGTFNHNNVKKAVRSIAAAVLVLASCTTGNEPVPITGSISVNGTAYPTITIGSQTWTTVNYTGGDGIPYAGSKLYTIAQATAITLPSGWHLPTESDLSTLMESARGDVTLYGFVLNSNGDIEPLALMSIPGWGGSNSLGFNALPTGYCTNPGHILGGSGTNAVFWSSSYYNKKPEVLAIQKAGLMEPLIWIQSWDETYYASIRFVKNY